MKALGLECEGEGAGGCWLNAAAARKLYNNLISTRMKFIVLGALAVLANAAFKAEDCPESKQIKCVDDTRAAYEPCKKAAEAGGSDTIADLNCLKYYSKMKTDCWPCICMIAHLDHVDLKGC